ncbi:MAG: hypothetical protein RMN52_04665 [Anaerolineae bacterium]|nr:hypothetical protein [Candidatus Roseilinea sp.]MDW8449274.1 hypothetical protein [Anaerolineae bacterium]
MQIRLLLPVVALLIAPACVQHPPATLPVQTPAVSPQPTPEHPQLKMRGVIAEITLQGVAPMRTARLRIVAESPVAGNHSGDLGIITVHEFHAVFDVRYGARRPASFDALQVGQRVELVISGPIIATNPVRASAESLTILE